MSNQVNERILEQILDDVLVLANGDMRNVVNAIKDEFGVENLPFVVDDKQKAFVIAEEDSLISKLVELRFDALCAWGG